MIVIPMAGQSHRFYEAGYDRPKFQLPLGRGTVFDQALGSFRAYFGSSPFLFIARSDDAAFVEVACRSLGITNFDIVALDGPTAGQAESVERGLEQVRAPEAAAFTIFNIDTFRPGFRYPEPWFSDLAGWLEVFRGSGENWSYVRPAPGLRPLAAETAEKRPISDLCCTGLYHFAAVRQFLAAVELERSAPHARELYVAPLYNHLIRQGLLVGWRLVGREEVQFCGVPSEYEALSSSAPP